VKILQKIITAPFILYFYIMMLPIQAMLWCVYKVSKVIANSSTYMPYIVGVIFTICLFSFAAIDKMHWLYWAFIWVGCILFIRLFCMFTSL